jgi:hypothetical protein
MAGSFDKDWYLRSTEPKELKANQKVTQPDVPWVVNDATNSATVLKRTMAGTFSTALTGAGSGMLTPTLSGIFANTGSGIEFSFNHDVTYTSGNGNVNTLGNEDTRKSIFTAYSLNYISEAYTMAYVEWVFYFDMSGNVRMTPPYIPYSSTPPFTDDGGYIVSNPTTIWTPLETGPQLTIYMR